jgi:Ca2+-binding EF-hand superfamily protein
MRNCLVVGISLLVVPMAAAQANNNDPRNVPQRPLPPVLAELIRGSAKDFIRAFDRNRDGYLTKTELPRAMAQNFDKFDRNGDGKLDEAEIETMLEGMRQRYGIESRANQANKLEADRMVSQWLRQMDKNKDGKISRDEAQGKLADNFDRLDGNGDGFLDKKELSKAAQRMVAVQKEKEQEARGRAPGARGVVTPPANGPDFDELDKDADGHLSREELQGTPWASKFDEMDTDKDGFVDRNEFNAYLKKHPLKKAKKNP